MSPVPEEDEKKERRRAAFEAAAAATGDTHDMLWDSLFALQQAADSNDWDALRRGVTEDFTEIPLHAFSLAAFGKAAAAGKLDIVEAMTDRGFRLPPGDAEDALAWLATSHPGTALPVVAFLLRRGLADPGPALLAVAAQGTPAAMEALREAGCDIRAQDGFGNSFSAAFFNGNPAMMNYLAAQGVELCTPATVKGLYGGLPASDTCRRLLSADRDKWRDRYAAAAPERPVLADFYKRLDKEVTLLEAAARGGKFPDVIAAAAGDSEQPLTPQELLRRDKNGASALSILAAHGDAAQVFDARAWHRHPDQVGPLRDALSEMGAGGVFDAAGFAADVQRCRLREQKQGRPVPRLPRIP